MSRLFDRFLGATSFNQPVGGWAMQTVERMDAMFAGASVFDQPLNAWNTISVTNMSYVTWRVFAAFSLTHSLKSVCSSTGICLRQPSISTSLSIYGIPRMLKT